MLSARYSLEAITPKLALEAFTEVSPEASFIQLVTIAYKGDNEKTRSALEPIRLVLDNAVKSGTCKGDQKARVEAKLTELARQYETLGLAG